MTDVREHNRSAWNRLVEAGDRWTVPVEPAEIARARRGDVHIVLTPTRIVPASWLGDLDGRRVLALASGGGQQAPLLAAAGAEVTVVDNAPAQLARDREVAAREGVSLETVEGDMRDLGALADDRFDLIVHPVANCFVDDVRPVWREAFRVLRPGGALLSGFCNPIWLCLDPEQEERGVVTLKYAVPFSPFTSLTDDERQQLVDRGEPLVFGHSFEDLVGGQLDAGFLLAGWYDDGFGDDDPVSRRAPMFAATRALKPDAAR